MHGARNIYYQGLSEKARVNELSKCGPDIRRKLTAMSWIETKFPSTHFLTAIFEVKSQTALKPQPLQEIF